MPSLSALQHMIRLSALGITGSIDGDGDIAFTHREKIWILFVDESDPMFFRIALPNFWPIEDEDERRRAHAACGRVTGTAKVAKVFVNDDNVWASAEVFLTSSGWESIFMRCLDTTWAAVQSFCHLMQEGGR